MLRCIPESTRPCHIPISHIAAMPAQQAHPRSDSLRSDHHHTDALALHQYRMDLPNPAACSTYEVAQFPFRKPMAVVVSCSKLPCVELEGSVRDCDVFSDQAANVLVQWARIL